MVRTWVLYILALLGAFIFFLFYKMWAAWYFLVILIILPIASLIVAITGAYSFDFESVYPEKVLRGQDASIDFKVSGIVAFLTFYRFRAHVKDVMTDEKHKLGDYQFDEKKPDIPIDTSHCGAFIYEISDVCIYDVLGFWRFRTPCEQKCRLIVYPVAELPGISPELNGYKARNIRKAKTASAEIYDIRKYVIGDPVKTIHWKASAKRDDILVKDLQEECYAHSRDCIRLTDKRDVIDARLGEVLFTTTYFLEHDLTARIRVITSGNREKVFDIETKKELEKTIVRILHMNIPKEAQDGV